MSDPLLGRQVFEAECPEYVLFPSRHRPDQANEQDKQGNMIEIAGVPKPGEKW